MSITQKRLMKAIIALILNSLSLAALSQDTIVMKNGTQQLVKVLEISATEVKFKKTDNLSGPLYIENKSQVESIRYVNGTIEKFAEVPAAIPVAAQAFPRIDKVHAVYYCNYETLTENRVQAKLLQLQNPEITQHVQDAKVYRWLQNIGFVALPLMLAANFSFIQNYDVYPNGPSQFKQPETLLALSALCVTGSVYFKIQRSHHNAVAVKLYNELY